MYIIRVEPWRGNQLVEVQRVGQYYYVLEARNALCLQDLDDLREIEGVRVVQEDISNSKVIIQLLENWSGQRAARKEVRDMLNRQLMDLQPNNIEFHREPAGFVGSLWSDSGVKFIDRAIFTVTRAFPVEPGTIARLRHDPHVASACQTSMDRCTIRVEGREGVLADDLEEAVRQILTNIDE